MSLQLTLMTLRKIGGHENDTIASELRKDYPFRLGSDRVSLDMIWPRSHGDVADCNGTQASKVANNYLSRCAESEIKLIFAIS
jgi:hypothetical protein